VSLGKKGKIMLLGKSVEDGLDYIDVLIRVFISVLERQGAIMIPRLGTAFLNLNGWT